MSHAENVAAGNFLVPNATFIVELLLFLIIFFVLARFVLPRIQSVMGDRRSMIEQQIADSEAARGQLADAQAAYRDALQDARAEASQIREDARAEAQRTMDEARATAQAEAARISAHGEEQLAGQRTAIVRDLRDEIGTLAVQLSEKIVDQPLAHDDVATTVDTFLAGVAADASARSGADT